MEICAGADSEIFELATQSSMGVADAQSNWIVWYL
jgi:hypothetical protein